MESGGIQIRRIDIPANGIHVRPAKETMDEILRYTDLAHTIQLARAAGFSTREIVRVLSGSLSYAEARELAKRAGPLLGVSTPEFLALRKNN